MEIKEIDILDKTNYGLNIYALILRQFYPNEVVNQFIGQAVQTCP